MKLCKRATYLIIVCQVFLVGCSIGMKPEVSTPADNEQVIREFLTAWTRLDAPELASYFTDDGVYYNMPTQPVKGRENVQSFVAGFIRSWSKTDWEILNIVAYDNLVMVERVDRTVVGNKTVELPCFGVFEMENGKIKIWRDYFDLATYTQGITP